MKKIAALALMMALLGLFGCGQPKSEEERFDPPGTAPGGETIHWTGIIPISEIDPLLGPGPFSVNELTDRFGQPTELTTSTPYIWPSLTVCFEYVFFTFILDTDQPWDEIETEQIDCDLPMEVYETKVMGGGELPLPRGIRLGDSWEEVRKAYPETPYSGGHRYDGTAELFYRYEGDAPGEYGVRCYFGNDRLECVEIQWSDEFAAQ